MAEAEARRKNRVASTVLRKAADQANTLINRNAQNPVAALTLDRKIATLDRAWEEVQRTYNAVSLLNIDHQAEDDQAYTADLAAYEQTRDNADLLTANNQPQPPAVPMLAEEVLVLEHTRERD